MDHSNALIIAETGGIMITPRPSPDNSTPKPGFPMRPFFGIDPVLVDDKVCVLRDLWHILILYIVY